MKSVEERKTDSILVIWPKLRSPEQLDTGIL